MALVLFFRQQPSAGLLNLTRLCPLVSKHMSDDAGAKKLKIYTKTGDKGVSSTFSGQRLPKDSDIFEALGCNDELNSVVGLAREFCSESSQSHDSVINKLQEIQSVLFDVGAHIATPRDKATPKKLAYTTFGSHHTDKLERWVDELDSELPALTNFILPSGGRASATLHLARTVCRRTERRVVPLYRSEMVEHEVVKYLNRLSDFLFTAARWVAQKEGKKEVIFTKVD